MVVTCRILRDTAVSRSVKLVYDYRCQICQERVQIGAGDYYAEGHHLKPLGEPHNGPDVPESVMCVCPNHHVQLDYGGIRIDPEPLLTSDRHKIGLEIIDYHNRLVVQNTA
jgi:predicted restriction endonuclease